MSIARRLIAILAGRWTLAVIAQLADGGRRYQDLDDALDGVSHKVLTDTLRRAERDVGAGALSTRSTPGPRSPTFSASPAPAHGRGTPVGPRGTGRRSKQIDQAPRLVVRAARRSASPCLRGEEAVRLGPGVDDVRVEGQSVDNCSDETGVADDRAPFNWNSHRFLRPERCC
jgi:hypothetical protein